jgi:hypothetical protein
VTRAGIDAPERGHLTLRLGLGGGVSDQAGAFETLSIRGALHDYLDPARGYPEDAQLQMAHVRLRYANAARTPAGGALRLDRLDAIDIVSAAPLDRWIRSVSWKIWVGADNARELGCERTGSDRAGWRCLYAGVTTGGGLAARFGPRRAALAYLLAETDLGAGPAFAGGGHYRVGGGAGGGVIADPGGRWRFELAGQALFYALGERRRNLRARAAQALSITPRLDLRLAAETAGTYAQVGAELCAYF